MCIGIGLQTAAKSVPMFIGARFCSKSFLHTVLSFSLMIIDIVVGFGLSFCQNAAPLLLIELSYPTHVRTLVPHGK